MEPKKISTARRYMGRPLKPAVPGARVGLGLKVIPAIKTKLDEAARANGRTQSAEAEYRLERSFEREDLLRDVWVLAFGESHADQYIKLLRLKIGLSEEMIQEMVKSFEKLLRAELRRDSSKWGTTKKGEGK